MSKTVTSSEIICEDFNPEVTLSDARFDDESLTIHGAALSYYQSRNGVRYDCMEKIGELSKGKMIYADKHLKDPAEKHKKLSEAGVVESVAPGKHRNRGDIKCFDNDAGRTFYWSSKYNSSSYALSHEVAHPSVSGAGKKRVCSDVQDVLGFIITQDPGATSGLFEEEEKMDLATLRADHPELVSALLEEFKAESKSKKDDSKAKEELLEAKVENAKIQKELDELKAANDQREAEEKELALVEEALEKLTKAAESDKDGPRILAETLAETFIEAKKDRLSELTDDDYSNFVKSLPLLSDEEEQAPPKKPGSRSGTNVKDDAHKARPRFSLSQVVRGAKTHIRLGK